MINNKFINLLKKNTIWVFLPILLVSAPLILFGNPGYYGDDFNMLGSLELFEGIIGSTYSWLSEYGYIYRPIGIFVLNSIYAILGNSDSLMYGFSLLIYSIFIYVVYRSAIAFTKDYSLAIFVTLFFSSFPFNATAFWQLSSLYMMLTGLFSVALIKIIFLKHEDFSLSNYIIVALIWTILLLSYEQITGLVAVLFLLIFLRNQNKGIFESFRLSLVTNRLIIIATLLFMGFFFVSSENPKVKTLNQLNQISVNIEEEFVDQKLTSEIYQEEIQTNSFSTSRIDAVKSKIKRSSLFLYNNFSYSLEALLKSGIKGSFILILLIFTMLLIYMYPIKKPSSESAIRQILFGFIWVASTLAPFFLYKSVHIPPYVLLIPSIGLAYFTYGIYWLLPFSEHGNFSKYLFKTFLALLIVNFQLQQYGYYFGLKEELSFWGEVASKYSEYQISTEQSKTLTISTQKKNNGHIFWIEKLVGERYFYDSIDRSRQQVSITIEKDSNKLIITNLVSDK